MYDLTHGVRLRVMEAIAVMDMISSYHYTPYIWPMVVGASLSAILGIYSWRHRNVPGATGLVFVALFGTVRLVASALQLAAGDFSTKILWFQIETSCLLPATVASLAFVLEYAGLESWLNRRNLALIAIPILISVPLYFTNDAHHLVWTRLWADGKILFHPGVLNHVLRGYGLLLNAAALSVLVALFIRSPLHRWPVALVAFTILTTVATRSVFRFAVGLNPVKPLYPLDLVSSINCFIFFLVLFRFRLFNLIPVARNSAIEQMRDGMVVLDAKTRIADLNRAAQELMGADRLKVMGCEVARVWAAHPDLVQFALGPDSTPGEIWLDDSRCCRVHVSQLANRRGFELGKLLMIYDVSEEKQAQKQLQDHQRKLATLEEREWLARELHDGVSQTLAAAHLQLKTACELLIRGQVTEARVSLDRLAEGVQEEKVRIGDYLFGVKAWPTKVPFYNGLRQYVATYSQNTRVRTELVIPPDMERQCLGETVETQLQRIIQEALTNIRKHANAHSARVIFAVDGGEVKIGIEDDGQGFDPAGLGHNQGFGLRAMAGRAEAVGARVEVKSTPGSGTQVIVQVPLPKGTP